MRRGQILIKFTWAVRPPIASTTSDAILIPFEPHSVDPWTGVHIGALVAEARAVNDLEADAVISRPGARQ
jgi:hypothetical protein